MPITEKYFIVDLIKKFDAEVVVVVQNYLGSINHSLLTLEALHHRGIRIAGLVFNGSPHEASHKLITDYSGAPAISSILKENEINKEVVLKYVKDFQNV